MRWLTEELPSDMPEAEVFQRLIEDKRQLMRGAGFVAPMIVLLGYCPKPLLCRPK